MVQRPSSPVSRPSHSRVSSTSDASAALPQRRRLLRPILNHDNNSRGEGIHHGSSTALSGSSCDGVVGHSRGGELSALSLPQRSTGSSISTSMTITHPPPPPPPRSPNPNSSTGSHNHHSSFLSPAQQRSLAALIDALLPSLPVPSSTTLTSISASSYSSESFVSHSSSESELHNKYWTHDLSTDKAYLEAVETAIQKLPAHEQWRFKTVLTLFSTRIGTCLLTGSYNNYWKKKAKTTMSQTQAPLPPIVPYSSSSTDNNSTLHDPTASVSSSSSSASSSYSTSLSLLLHDMQHSRSAWRQQVFTSIKSLLCGIAYSYTVAGKNPFWPAMGYPGPPQLLQHSQIASSSPLLPSSAAASAVSDTAKTVAAMARHAWIKDALLLLPSPPNKAVSVSPPSTQSTPRPQSLPVDATTSTSATTITTTSTSTTAPSTTTTSSTSATSTTTTTTSTPTPTLECDILIVGSGAGGSVAASVLARAGYQVLIVEKGLYRHPAATSNVELDAYDQLYEQHGMLATSHHAIRIFAGSTLGGGTAINWSACLALPHFIREEWSRLVRTSSSSPDDVDDSAAYGLHELFGLGNSTHTHSNHHADASGNGGNTSASESEYDQALAYILNKLGVNEKSKASIVHNPMNVKLQQGCTILGYPWQRTGLNVRNTAEATADPALGFLGLGDRYGYKNDGVSVFLKDAVKHGAKILTQCQVQRVRLSSTSSSSSSSSTSQQDDARPRVIGAVCQVTSRRTTTTSHNHHEDSDSSISSNHPNTRNSLLYVSVRQAVVMAAGALHTPCILQKSGLANPHIGRHLHLHPTTHLMGVYNHHHHHNNDDHHHHKDDQPTGIINPFLGAPLTTVCTQFEHGPNTDGYGARIECPSAHPGLMASALAWTTPLEFKDRLRHARNAVPLMVLQRDTSEGTVQYGGRDGKTLMIDYDLNEADQASMIAGLKGGLQILLTSGAHFVTTSHINDPGFVVLDDPSSPSPSSLVKLASHVPVQNYLRSVTALGLKNYHVSLFSAHQMGSCRMSPSPLTGAVDINGETWDCDNLFVMDASVFPTASGVNPMVTILTIAKMLSSRLALRLKYQDQQVKSSSSSTQQAPPQRVGNNGPGWISSSLESVKAQELLAKRQEMRSKRYPSYSEHRHFHKKNKNKSRNRYTHHVNAQDQGIEDRSLSLLSLRRQIGDMRKHLQSPQIQQIVRVVLPVLVCIALLTIAVMYVLPAVAGKSSSSAASSMASSSLHPKTRLPPSPQSPPSTSTYESWTEQLAQTWANIRMPGLIPTSILWSILLFPFF